MARGGSVLGSIARVPAVAVVLAMSLLACEPSDPITGSRGSTVSAPRQPLVTDVPDASTSPLVGEGAIAFAIGDLVERLGYDESEVTLDSIEAVDWPDSGLGCFEVDEDEEPGPFSGYRIVLTAGGQRYEYHGAAGEQAPRACPGAE